MKTELEIVEMLHAYDELQSSRQLFEIQKSDLKKSAISAGFLEWLRSIKPEELQNLLNGKLEAKPYFDRLESTVSNFQYSVDIEMKTPVEAVEGKIAVLKKEIEDATTALGHSVKGDWDCRYTKESIRFNKEKAEGYMVAQGIDVIAVGLAEKTPARSAIYPGSKK